MRDTFEPFRQARFFRSFSSASAVARSDVAPIPAIAFTGRSNAGKSSLISALCERKDLAKVSKTPGKTRLINYFYVPEGSDHPEFYLVDLPGFGYARLPQKEVAALHEMIRSYLLNERFLRLTIIVLDAKRKAGEEELSLMQHNLSIQRPFFVARSRWDRLNQKERAAAQKRWMDEDLLPEISIPVSSTHKLGLDEVHRRIRAVLTN
jgi:GTP-binding protein